MEDRPIADFAVDRRASALGSDDGYDVWFGVTPQMGDAATSELQTLCQGAMAVGHVGSTMQWDWPTTLEMIGHLSAPVDGYLLIEISEKVFYGQKFRNALLDAVRAAGLDPFKVRVSEMDAGDLFILGDGLPPV